ncbi:phospholipase [Pseudomonas sp. CAN2814]|uniref:phospholipase D-like domain-containing protein n=1 Tax=Pseudomonas sp. CAN1 TaxID=3046726 RepID=UPI0026486EC2|nr:phospholipase D-like domain-containing protein [Pseudomonas sp. CAN1]MDN6860170.1 phospholipase [Pseudomonas sp. CAN1]
MSQCDIVVPIALQHTNEGVCTSPWWVQDAEYAPALASYEPLINGEVAFKAVYKAIDAAQKSIDIICWGFQPSMYFIRDGAHLSIGALLVEKARKGIQVRLLAWEMPLNATGMSGEANLPGKSPNLMHRAGQTATDQQHNYDEWWFDTFSVDDDKAAQRVHEKVPVLVTRGFSENERSRIGADVRDNGPDRDTKWKTRAAMVLAPSHHQKSVLVDYELPDQAVGFVMGHNMLDEYWDTDAHSALMRPDPRNPNPRPGTYEPNRGPRGALPRQDISSRVTGPILEYLHQNFAQAWQKETGEDLLTLRKAKEVGSQLQCGKDGTPLLAQLLRTQPQVGKHDIEKAYLQAANNATRFIYIENQYFRWPPLAELVKKVADDQTGEGRDPGKHGPLHLFVTTNVTDGGIGMGVVNTQRMLESLGRADTMPEVTRKRVEKAMPPRPRVQGRDDLTGPRELEQWKHERDRRTEELLHQEVPPGLKMVVCSLVAPDSPPGKDWVPVYIHSKLMIVNDVYTTHGSANINTRSMRVDSELNLAHEWHAVTRKMRQDLWRIHTTCKVEPGEDVFDGVQDDPEEAFDAWQAIIEINKKRQEDMTGTPYASIVEFHYARSSTMDLD